MQGLDPLPIPPPSTVLYSTISTPEGSQNREENVKESGRSINIAEVSSGDLSKPAQKLPVLTHKDAYRLMVISCLERSNRLKYRHLSLLNQLHLLPQSPLVLDSMVWIWSRKESKATTASPGLKHILVQLLGRVGDIQKRAVDENASEPPLRKGSIICSQNLYLSLTCGMGRSKLGLGFLSHQIPYDSKPLVIHLYTKNVTKPHVFRTLSVTQGIRKFHAFVQNFMFLFL